MTILIGPGGPRDRAYLPLATRRGKIIPNERRLERHPAALRAAFEARLGHEVGRFLSQFLLQPHLDEGLIGDALAFGCFLDGFQVVRSQV
jgi:hypothetical protein